MSDRLEIPKGKTKVVAIGNTHQSEIKKGDVGYIDGYCRGGNDVPFLVFVRLSDGRIDFVSTYNVTAINKNDGSAEARLTNKGE